MDLHALKVFQTVSRTGSITRAAQELNYAQSNVTTKIQQLESYFHTTLLYRHNRGITLTSKGHTLLAYAERIFQLIEESAQAMQDDPFPNGPLRIGSMETTAAVRLPEYLVRYHRDYPNVDLTLITGPTEEHIQAVLHYELDGAFVAGPIDHPELLQRTVLQEELVLITDSSHPAMLDAAELKTRTILVFRQGCSYRARLQSWLHQEGIYPEKIMEFGSLEAILGCVKAGLGISLLPLSVVEPYIQEGTLQTHSLPNPLALVQTVFIRRKDTLLTPALGHFIDMFPSETMEE